VVVTKVARKRTVPPRGRRGTVKSVQENRMRGDSI
jgi:hypothetical protein